MKRSALVGGLVMCALALQFAVGVTPALAVTCSFNGLNHIASASMDANDPIAEFVHVIRSGDNIMFGTLGNEQACGTVSTVQTMNIDMANSHQSLSIDLSNGPFAPGFPDEGNGSSEVEFNLTNASSTAGIGVNGSGGDDAITVGTSRSPLGGGTIHVINLNAAEGSGLDNDVGIHGLSADATIGISGQAGNDHLLASGTGTGLAPGPAHRPGPPLGRSGGR